MQRQATPKFFSAAGKHMRKKRDRLKNFCIDCYPYGMPMPGRSVYSNYRYGYQGEFAETDSETGMPAFELRLWDSRIGRWLTTDPARQYDSPYLGMGNNPVSRIDSDGGMDNPVYDKKGSFLGTTESGFTGEALIMNAEDFTQGMTDADAFSLGTFMSDFNFSSPSIRDAIESHIVNFKLGDGLDIPEQIHIQSKKEDFVYSAREATPDNLLIQRGIDKKGNSIADEFYEPTVENIRNVVNIHEVRGHVVSGIKDRENHYKVVLMQINHKQFHSTTDKFKGKTLHSLYSLKPSILNDSRLNSLYYEFGYPFYVEFNRN